VKLFKTVGKESRPEAGTGVREDIKVEEQRTRGGIKGGKKKKKNTSQTARGEAVEVIEERVTGEPIAVLRL
jgi:hypothetical protein